MTLGGEYWQCWTITHISVSLSVKTKKENQKCPSTLEVLKLAQVSNICIKRILQLPGNTLFSKVFKLNKCSTSKVPNCS